MRDYDFSDGWIVLILFGVIILMIWRSIAGIDASYGNEAIIDIKINSTSIEISNGGEKVTRTKYVYTPDEVFTVEDRFFNGYNRSMDAYNKLSQNQGKTCTVKTVGERYGLISSYRNIVEVIECK